MFVATLLLVETAQQYIQLPMVGPQTFLLFEPENRDDRVVWHGSMAECQAFLKLFIAELRQAIHDNLIDNDSFILSGCRMENLFTAASIYHGL